MPSGPSIAELQERLLDAHDPQERASVHLELGRRALQDGRLEAAIRHLREALLHNRRLEDARALLLDLGEESVARDRGPGRGVMRTLLGRWGRRSKAGQR